MAFEPCELGLREGTHTGWYRRACFGDATCSFADRFKRRKPDDVSEASAKLTLLAGTEQQEVKLKPAGDKLEATGSFMVGPGAKAVAVVTVAGNASTARFTIK